MDISTLVMSKQVTNHSNPSYNFQEIAFLDTNALHFVRLYINLAYEDKLYPFSPEMEATEIVIGQKKDSLRTAYNKGLDVVTFCIKHNLLIQYSNVSTLELVVGRARGEALLKAATEGVPERKWTGFANRDDEVAAYLEVDVLQGIRQEISQLVSRLESIEIYMNSDEDNVVSALALELAGLVYMTTADCVILAHALTARAQYVLTYDNYFRTIVNGIYNSPKYDAIRQQIKNSIPDVHLPHAPRLSR